MTDGRLHLDDQLCFAAYSASNAIIRSYRPRLARLGLTYPQYLVMIVLWQDGPSTVGQIAARLDLASHAVTPLVNRLAATGFLERRVDARDRRVVHVHPTETGRDLRAAALSAQRSVAADLGLPSGRLARLRQELRGVADRLAGVRAATPMGGPPDQPAPHRPGLRRQPKKTSASA